MQTITIKFSDYSVLNTIKELEKRKLVKIVQEPEISLFAIPGRPISENAFQEWIAMAENSSTLSYSETKKRWDQQKEKIKELIP